MEKIKRTTRDELEKFRCEDHDVVPLNKVYNDCAGIRTIIDLYHCIMNSFMWLTRTLGAAS